MHARINAQLKTSPRPSETKMVSLVARSSSLAENNSYPNTTEFNLSKKVGVCA